MKKMGYFAAGVLILGLVFPAENSFSQLNASGTMLYSRPEPKCLASGMILSELKTSQGIYLAEISDLLIDPANGSVSNVVLVRIRGMGSKVLLIPFNAVTRNGEDYYGPEDVYQITGEAPYRSRNFNLHSGEKSGESFTATQLIGAMLRDPKGKDLGQIDDLVVDHTVGRVIGFIVSGMAGRLVTVPFSALSEGDKGAFILKTF